MNIGNLYKIFARSLFFLGFAILAVGFFEVAANFFGYTVLGDAYNGGRLIEIAAALVVFVIAVLLRQIRDNFANRDSN